MKEIVNWLLMIERLAGGFYGDAASFFQDDAEFSGLLSHLAEEEAWHCHVMESAAALPAGEAETASAITVDGGTKEKVEGPFRENSERLKAGALTKKAAIDCMAATEFSEWNDIFLYVVNTLKDRSREFVYAAAKIQAHKQRIEKFLGTVPEGKAHLEKIRRLPAVWTTRILIVEDYAGILEFLRDLLSREGIVETAVNGKEGLEKARGSHYDVILADIDMPVMNGMDFYKAALRQDAHVGERFLFMAGNPSDEEIAFFEGHGLKYLTKPMLINEIEEGVSEIMRRIPQKKLDIERRAG